MKERGKKRGQERERAN